MRVKRTLAPGSRRGTVGLHPCLAAKHGFLHRRACYGGEVQVQRPLFSPTASLRGRAFFVRVPPSRRARSGRRP
jgi:hypothetical protein